MLASTRISLVLSNALWPRISTIFFSFGRRQTIRLDSSRGELLFRLERIDIVSPRYKERLRTKMIKSNETTTLDASQWVFLKKGVDDFRDGAPIEGSEGLTERVRASHVIICTVLRAFDRKRKLIFQLFCRRRQALPRRRKIEHVIGVRSRAKRLLWDRAFFQ